MKLTTLSSTIFQPFGGGSGGVVFGAIDVLAATETWWANTPTANTLTADGRLWLVQAPESTQLPFATVSLKSEDLDTQTTGFGLYRSSVEIRLHAATPALARAMALTLRLAFKQAPLSIAGQAVLHVLPDGSGVERGDALAPGGRDCWVGVEAFDVPWTQAFPIAGAGADGADVLAATQAWFGATDAASSLTDDGRLWYLEAPETTALPYATFFLVAEPVDTWTTGFALYRSSIQINLHAATAVQARTLAIALRAAFTLTPLTINGSPVLHVLPDGDNLLIGDGLGPGGRDCWLAYETFEIPWTE